MVARELLQCRLLEGGRDVLLERVAELLGFAASGAHPFCTQLPSQAQGGLHGGSAHARGLQGYSNATKLSAPDRRRRCPRSRSVNKKDSTRHAAPVGSRAAIPRWAHQAGPRGMQGITAWHSG